MPVSQTTKQRMETYARTKLQANEQTLDPYRIGMVTTTELPANIRAMIAEINSKWRVLDKALEPYMLSLEPEYERRRAEKITAERLFRTTPWNTFYDDLKKKIETTNAIAIQDCLKEIWDERLEDYTALDATLDRIIEQRDKTIAELLRIALVGPQALKKQTKRSRG